MGPAEAPVLKVKSEFRYQILLKAARRTALRDTFEKAAIFRRKGKMESHLARHRR